MASPLVGINPAETVQQPSITQYKYIHCSKEYWGQPKLLMEHLQNFITAE